MMRTSVAFILFTLLLLAGAIAHLSIGARVIAPDGSRRIFPLRPAQF